VSQNADTVKVGAVVSDTRPCLRPPRVTDPTLSQAVTSSLYSRCLWHLSCLIRSERAIVLAEAMPRIATITAERNLEKRPNDLS
jgi:hypothetical protein